jgi:hypothetical protein
MSDSLRIQQYRARAQELRARATEAQWAEIQAQLLDLARLYDRLVDSLEQEKHWPKI